MGCRIGMSTDPEERKRYWESQYEGFADWEILAEGLSKDAAQEKETELAAQRGCESSPGGEGPDEGWSVYYFTFTGKK